MKTPAQGRRLAGRPALEPQQRRRMISATLAPENHAYMEQARGNASIGEWLDALIEAHRKKGQP